MRDLWEQLLGGEEPEPHRAEHSMPDLLTAHAGPLGPPPQESQLAGCKHRQGRHQKCAGMGRGQGPYSTSRHRPAGPLHNSPVVLQADTANGWKGTASMLRAVTHFGVSGKTALASSVLEMPMVLQTRDYGLLRAGRDRLVTHALPQCDSQIAAGGLY